MFRIGRKTLEIESIVEPFSTAMLALDPNYPTSLSYSAQHEEIAYLRPGVSLVFASLTVT